VSLTSPVPDPGTGIVFTAVGQVCFYCGELLSDPAVHWSGFTAEVYLHPQCVVALAVRLGRDLHELAAPAYYARLRQ
jgi:hypothetical protein